VVLVLAAASLEACCVNPFIHTDTDVAPDAPGSAARETGGTLEESRPAVQLGERGIDAPGSGFDIRLLRVQPGVHLGTEQVCDVVAVGRLEPLELGAQEAPRTAYGPGITHRMSIQCTSTTGESWADLAFDVTRATRASEVQVGMRIRVRLARADGGFFDYPIVDFVAVVGPAQIDFTKGHALACAQHTGGDECILTCQRLEETARHLHRAAGSERAEVADQRQHHGRVGRGHHGLPAQHAAHTRQLVTLRQTQRGFALAEAFYTQIQRLHPRCK
jgi:hypothetical protein